MKIETSSSNDQNIDSSYDTSDEPKVEPNNPVGQFGYFPLRISFQRFISSSKPLHSVLKTV